MSVVVGLLGGVASGKSRVAQVFEDLGAEVVDGDVLARQAIDRAPVREALCARFGADIYDESEVLRPRVLAERAFRGTEEDAQALDHIVHPPVLREVEERIAAVRPDTVLVLDLPLLLEKGLHTRCDVLVFVDTPKVLRQERARDRGWSADEIDVRQARQAPLSEKRAAAEIVIKNDKDLDALEKKARMVFVEQIQTLLSPDS